jgi:hypothetical protein
MAPVNRPQIAAPKPPPPTPPRLDRLDEQIVSLVREHGPVKLWTVLNVVAEKEGARNRAAGRSARLDLWHHRVKRLKRLGLVFGRGRNELAVSNSDRERTRRRTRRRGASGGGLPRIQAVSAVSPADQDQQLQLTHPVGTEVFRRTEPPTSASTDSAKSESVIAPEQASEAGRALSKLPRRQPRRWAGWLGGRHCWRGRLVVLSDGEVAPLIWCNWGRVLLQNVRDLPFREWLAWGAIREHQVKLWKNPAAVALGKRKSGVVETRSEAKAAAARRNGGKPCRPGKIRGRPRTAHLFTRTS